MVLLLGVFILIMITACNKVSVEKLNDEALNLAAKDVPAWLKKHDIQVPVDYAEELDVNQFVLDVIHNAKEGIDSSVAISYEKTVNFIHQIQKAAGYTFKY